MLIDQTKKKTYKFLLIYTYVPQITTHVVKILFSSNQIVFLWLIYLYIYNFQIKQPNCFSFLLSFLKCNISQKKQQKTNPWLNRSFSSYIFQVNLNYSFFFEALYKNEPVCRNNLLKTN